MAVRITGGVLRGRQIDVPRTGVRPTQDRVRNAIFSALLGRVEGARVLDLFGGSGAMGLEALSRGAAHVCWVESDRRTFAILRENVRRLCSSEPAMQGVRWEAGGGGRPVADGRVTVNPVCADVSAFFVAPPEGVAYDLVFADPPYDRDGAWVKKILSALSVPSTMAADGRFVFEQAAGSGLVSAPGWELEKDRPYGGTRVLFWRRAI